MYLKRYLKNAVADWLTSQSLELVSDWNALTGALRNCNQIVNETNSVMGAVLYAH